MKLPKKFILSGKLCDWEVTKTDDLYVFYAIQPKTGGRKYVGDYSEQQIVYWITNTEYGYVIKQVIEQGEDEVTNGVDAQGEKLNFTKGDLKLFMRVTTRNGNQYIVVPDAGHGIALARRLGWMDVCFNEGDAEDEGYLIDYVYAAPKHAYKMLDESSTGDLLWKRQEAVAEENSEFAARIAYLQTHIDAVKENLESLQKEYDQLKKEVHA